jgi:hypothetical protein
MLPGHVLEMKGETSTMPKAKINLNNGTVVEIEGTHEEVQKLLQFYGTQAISEPITNQKPQAEHHTNAEPTEGMQHSSIELDLTEIVNLVKTCDEAQSIETQILDRTSEVNRVLLPLYIVNQYLDDAFGLTTIEIATITTDLGIRVFRQNALRALTSSGSRYVIGDRVRKIGTATRYKLNRRGVQYMKDILKGQPDDGKK